MKLFSIFAIAFIIVMCGCSKDQNPYGGIIPLPDDMINEARFEISGGLGTIVFDNSEELGVMYFPTDKCTLLFGVFFENDDYSISTGTYMFNIADLGKPINTVYLDGGSYYTDRINYEDQVSYTNLAYNGYYADEEGSGGQFRSMTVTKCDYYEVDLIEKYYHVVGTFEYDAFETTSINKMGEFQSNFIDLIWRHDMTALQAAKALGMREIKCRGKFDVWIPVF